MTKLMKINLLDGCTSSNMKFYEHCIFEKHKRVKFNTSVYTTKGTLDYVHADLWGPSRKPSLIHGYVACDPMAWPMAR